MLFNAVRQLTFLRKDSPMVASSNLLLGSQLQDSIGDLLPWADPYIAQLIDDHQAALAREAHGLRLVELRRQTAPARRVLAVAS
jgi:hypothetical protein